jgi:hypothetical protein
MSSEFLQKDVIYVSSAARSSGSSNNFRINLSQQITSGIKYDTATLLSFSCTNSYYLFSSNNNTFLVNENGTIHTITIPPGNYTFSSLKSVLNTLFVASLSYTYSIVASTVDGQYQFTVSGNGGIQPIFDFSGSNSPYEVLGFEKLSYTFAADYLESANIVNFQKTNTIELCCDFVNRGILSVIIPNTSDFSVINYNEYNSSFASHELSKNNFMDCNFWLLDGNTGNALDLNGLNFNFTFVLYKKNDYYQHMLDDRKMELQIIELDRQLKELEAEKK